MHFPVRLNHVVVAGAAITSTAACSSDSNSATTTNSDAGTDAGGTVDSSSLSLYERLGGKAGIESFVKSVVEKDILTDPDLKTFFFNQVATPIPAGHPSGQQITVCFGRFVGAALQADTYPGAPVNDPTNTNTPNHTCRSMVDSHKGANTMLDIGSGNFDKFIGYIAQDLTPLVVANPTNVGEISQAEFDALAAALTGQKDAVTTPGAPSSGPFQAP